MVTGKCFIDLKIRSKIKIFEAPATFERMIIIISVYLLQNPVVSCSKFVVNL